MISWLPSQPPGSWKSKQKRKKRGLAPQGRRHPRGESVRHLEATVGWKGSRRKPVSPRLYLRPPKRRQNHKGSFWL